MKKGDWIIICFIGLIVLGLSVYAWRLGLNDQNKRLIISQHDAVIYEIKLSDDYSDILIIEDGDHYNEVHIDQGEIWIETANCPNQVCVKSPSISKNGQSIICIPHELVLKLQGDNESYDILVE